MDSNGTEPKKFSYPNADRVAGDSGETTGPVNPANSSLPNHDSTQGPTPASRGESIFKPKPSQKIIKETIHITDALQNEALKKPADLQNIRTFQSDIANVVKTDNVSLIKIALAEKRRQERQGTYEQTLNVVSSPNRILFIGIPVITLIFVIGGFFLWSVYFKTTPTKKVSDDVVTLATPPFETEKISIIDVKGKDFNDAEHLIAAEKKDIISGSMKRIKFIKTDSNNIKKDLSTQDWLTFFQTEAQGSLIRALDPGFIFGFYSLRSNIDSFIIFKVNSYDNAYAGMLQWEPSIESDIGGFIENKNNVATAATSTESTSTPQSNQFRGKPFVDRIINNKDTRVLLGDFGRIKIVYSFVDQNTLVIASGETVLREVIFRLTTGRISR